MLPQTHQICHAYALGLKDHHSRCFWACFCWDVSFMLWPECVFFVFCAIHIWKFFSRHRTKVNANVTRETFLYTQTSFQEVSQSSDDGFYYPASFEQGIILSWSELIVTSKTELFVVSVCARLLFAVYCTQRQLLSWIGRRPSEALGNSGKIHKMFHAALCKQTWHLWPLWLYPKSHDCQVSLLSWGWCISSFISSGDNVSNKIHIKRYEHIWTSRLNSCMDKTLTMVAIKFLKCFLSFPFFSLSSPPDSSTSKKDSTLQRPYILLQTFPT